MKLREAMKKHVHTTLIEQGYHKGKTAKELGVSRSTLDRYLKLWGHPNDGYPVRHT